MYSVCMVFSWFEMSLISAVDASAAVCEFSGGVSGQESLGSLFLAFSC